MSTERKSTSLDPFRCSWVGNESLGCNTDTLNYNGDCVCDNGFHIVAEGLDVIPRTAATNGIISFEGTGRTFVCQLLWLRTQRERHVGR
jgi:hypothetical protein